MILIVEDDPQVARLIELVLKRNGAETRMIDDGKKAIAAIRELRPRMVIADLGIKGIAGDELCRLVRADEEVGSTPFVVLSGDRDGRERASDCGADAFLGKPFEFEDLADLLRKHADDD